MSHALTSTNTVRPPKFVESDPPPIPQVDTTEPDVASLEYSQHRTKLSTHRTALSEHRTSLSEYRTDLSGERTDMSMRRTGMSFQRTRMSAERTLMSVIRTALSLISFGFTIFQFFERLYTSNQIGNANSGRNFGMALVLLGVAMVTLGIVYHVQFMWGLRLERKQMTEEGLIYGQSHFPVSFTLVTAVLLLMLGLLAIASMVFNIGPFG